ncbi:unnamed protein product [Mytilus edulis]|uniref:DDE Tnp4 domain-containing protein n=1 Tax=Mytilus edulis TaxID=6550 RepID=A0A8S3TEG1_MYTED|nr:unnamed protein product [Mytilus edulis]
MALETATLGFAGEMGDVCEEMFKDEISRILNSSTDQLRDKLKAMLEKSNDDLKNMLDLNGFHPLKTTAEECKTNIKLVHLKQEAHDKQLNRIESSTGQTKDILTQIQLTTKRKLRGEVKHMLNNFESIIKVAVVQAIEEEKGKHMNAENRKINIGTQVDSKSWDEENTLKNLSKIVTTEIDRHSADIEEFHVKSLENKCIQLELVAFPDVFQNAHTLRKAVKSLINQLVKAGEIDTYIPGKLEIKLTVKTPLTKEELAVVYSVFDKHEMLEESTATEMNVKTNLFDSNLSTPTLKLEPAGLDRFNDQSEFTDKDDFALNQQIKMEKNNEEKYEEMFVNVDNMKCLLKLNGLPNDLNQPESEEVSPDTEGNKLLYLEWTFECPKKWNLSLIVSSITDNRSSFPDEFPVDYVYNETTNTFVMHTTAKPFVFRSYSSLEAAVVKLIGKIINVSSIELTEPDELSASVLIMTKPEEDGLERALTKREEDMIEEDQSDNDSDYSVGKITFHEEPEPKKRKTTITLDKAKSKDASKSITKNESNILVDVKQALQKLAEIPLLDYYLKMYRTYLKDLKHKWIDPDNLSFQTPIGIEDTYTKEILTNILKEKKKRTKLISKLVDVIQNQDMSKVARFTCVLCTKRTKNHDRRFLGGESNKGLRKYLYKYFFLNVDSCDVICGACRRKYYRQYDDKSITNAKPDKQVLPAASTSQQTLVSPKTITLSLSSIGGSHSTCFVCRKRGPKLIVVSSSTRLTTFVQNNIIIPAGARCCPGHISDENFSEQAIECLSDLRKTTDFNRSDILDLLQKIRMLLLKNEDKRLNFDKDSTLSDAEYISLTGIDKTSFSDLASHLVSIRDTKVRSSRTCLGIFLTKMRSGMSNKLMATIFNVGKDSIRRAVTTVRKNLMQTFVPKHLGFNHISRENLIENHTRPLAQTLFGNEFNPAILVIDGTYIYIQKSGQFQFQRRTFSMHKHRPLVKPMVFVTTTGYFVSVMGPYLADNNEQIKSWLQKDDVFIVDRGFRDSIDLLEELGIQTEMPSFLKKGQAQFTTEESNTSRLITKIRWVVESANGRIKTWVFFNHVMPNSQIPYIGDYLRIVCSICNKYFKPLSSGDPEEDQLLGCKMIYLSKQNNLLKEKIESENLDRIRSNSTTWCKIDAASIEFPSITEEDLRNLTLGVYQIKLAKSYVAEHVTETVTLSRHVSSKAHLLWIQYDEVTVLGWFCKCRAGARVVGMCAHVSAVIWYLGYARCLDIPYCSGDDWTKYLIDARNMPEPEIIDESDESDCVEE